jgi:hypothetical protein
MDAVKKHKYIEKMRHVSRRRNRNNNISKFGRRRIYTERRRDEIFFIVKSVSDMKHPTKEDKK